MRKLNLVIISMFFATTVFGHCDWINGPVVQSARQALATGNVTPVFRWVQLSDEGEIRDAFTRTMQVRTKGAEAKELADRWFFEPLRGTAASGGGTSAVVTPEPSRRRDLRRFFDAAGKRRTC